MPPEPSWSNEQLEYLDDNSALYAYCYEDNDLVEFLPSFYEAFFARWPERQVLWPDIPESQALTIEQQQLLHQAEEGRKLSIKAQFETKRTQSTAWIPYVPFPTVLASFHEEAKTKKPDYK